ncbi:MAG TPA: FAD-binding oxidoreductase [Asanoa sp.]|nr:FAD-binding oxidoreductase [Asanoa sp.]
MDLEEITITARDGDRVAVPVDQLSARLDGRLLRPGAAGWDDAVRIWNAMVAKTPALVVQPETAHDVAATVDFARTHGLLLSIKGGGHHIAGVAVADGGITVDMSRMSAVTVDPDARLAHVGPGCRLQDVDRATQEYGLATPLGFISEVGAAGLTLGGGLGYLTRRFGWAVDNLEEVEIVTADGRIHTASREENAELFWAVRGAGANMGAVTRLTYRLHEVGPTVCGGLVAWPFEGAADILRAYRSITAEAPRELAVWLLMLRAPAAPFVPPAWHGRRVCLMVVCFTGDLDDADQVLAPIRALPDPVLSLLGPQPYTQIQSYLDITEPKGMHYYWKTGYLTDLSDGFLTTIRQLCAECPVPDAELGVLHLAGAINDRAPDDGAVGNRDARYVVGANGMWAPGDPDTDMYQAWIREAWRQIEPFTTGGSYINFQTADEAEERIHATYGANLDRLVEAKTAYDPDNVFRCNRNIAPRR